MALVVGLLGFFFLPLDFISPLLLVDDDLAGSAGPFDIGSVAERESFSLAVEIWKKTH